METKTTVRFPTDMLKQARIKAANDGLSLSKVLRQLLRLWLRDNITLEITKDSSRQVQLARESFGMWSDRDPDEYLIHSRAGLTLRDKETQRPGDKVIRRLGDHCHHVTPYP